MRAVQCSAAAGDCERHCDRQVQPSEDPAFRRLIRNRLHRQTYLMPKEDPEAL